MRQPSSKASLSLKEANETGFSRALWKNTLETDLPFKTLVAATNCEERLGHTTTPQGSQDLEGPELHVRQQPNTLARPTRRSQRSACRSASVLGSQPGRPKTRFQVSASERERITSRAMSTYSCVAMRSGLYVVMFFVRP